MLSGLLRCIGGGKGSKNAVVNVEAGGKYTLVREST